MLCCLASCSSNNDEEGTEPRIGEESKVYLQSYVIRYVDASLELIQSGGFGYDKLRLSFKYNKDQCYTAPEVGGEGENAKRFAEIATQKGDISYNQGDISVGYMERVCPIDDYKKVKIVCLNKEINAEHPKGSDLGDIMQIYLLSYADYIHNGYKGDLSKEIEKHISELTSKDLTLFNISKVAMWFDTLPAPGEYEMQITMVKTNGEEQTATCTFKVEA